MAGYSAHPRRLNFARMREIADSVGAVLLVDMAHFAGLVAGGVFTGEFNPIPYAHVVTSTTHKTLRGPRGGFILCKQEFTEVVNKGCPVVLGGPLPHVMAAKAVAFKEANTPAFKIYAQKIVENARSLADHFLKKGARLVTGGTENHLMILDVSRFGLTGRHAETALRAAHITVNRNAIPFDAQGPWYTSGVRLGTPALTTLGMGTEEMKEIADIIFSVLSHTQPAIVPKTGQPSKANSTTKPEILEAAQKRVKELLSCFPLYPEIEI
jgi:glycine hydroxymethyltransferase